MTPPRVSVLMPVFNGEYFLKEAIDSILGQTFHDFELVVVDDGSCDATAAILAGYDDSRLVVIKHETNRGVIAARNRAVSEGLGEFFAMMDSDDISHPHRLAYQVAYLEQHPECDVVASRIMLIDAEGRYLGDWHDDSITVTPTQIRRFLPRANCIANSSVMLRADLLRCRGYTCPRGVTEDYDLWLRLAVDEVQFAKLQEQLVYYRITPGSLTAQTQGMPSEYQQIRSKRYFLTEAVRQGRWGAFVRQVAGSLVRDVVRLFAKKILRLLLGEWPDDNRNKLVFQLNHTSFVWLLVRLSSMIGSLLPVVNRSGLFFFFPFYHTGGAERVHSQIAGCFKDQQPWMFFAKRSADRGFREQFEQSGRCFDIGPLLKYTYPLSVGILAGLISKHTHAQVFGCNSLYYYLLLPHLPAHVRATDLLHALGGGAEQFSLPVLERLQQRVVISRGVRDELLAFYRSAGVDPALDSRITVIANRVEVAATMPEKSFSGPLQVLFVGRGSEEKRVHLIGRAARRCRERGMDIEFTLVGDLEGWLHEEDRPCCTLTGLISSETALTELYRQSHLILISSSREGFPLTLMEGMAQGCVPVCTAVGGIPEHIRHLENGWLLPPEDEDAVVAGLYAALEKLSQDRALLGRLSGAAFSHAQIHFGSKSFCAAYRRALN